MSIQLMTLVFNSALPPGQKLVLLALADHADDFGEHCFPSVARVGRKASLSERQVQRVLSDLRAGGLLEVIAEATRYEPTHYRIRGDKLTPLSRPGVTPVTPRGDTHVVSGVTPTSPEPPIEPPVNPSKGAAAKNAAPRSNGASPGPNDMQAYLLTRLQDSNDLWRRLTFGAVVKANKRFGRPVVLAALQRLWEEKPTPANPYPFFVAVCNEVAQKAVSA